MVNKKFIKLVFLLFLFSGFSSKAQNQELTVQFNDEFFKAFNSFNEKDFDESILQFEELSAKFPKEASIYYYLAKSYQANNKINLANEAIAKAFALEKGSLDIGMLYIETLLKTGDSKTALEVIDSISRFDQPRYEIEMLRIEANLNLGNYDQAIASLEDESQTYYDYPEVLRTKQYVYSRLKKWPEFAKASGQFTRNYPFELIFGWEIFPMISPQFFPNIKPFIDSLYQEFSDQKQLALWNADYYITKKDISNSIQYLRESLSDSRLDSTQIGTRIINCFDLINTVPEVDSLEKLILDAEIVFPNDFRLKALLGDIYFQKNNSLKAQENYAKALNNGLGNELMWSRIIALDLELNDTLQAHQHIDKAIKSFPLSGIFYYQLGFLYQIEGNYSLSIDALNASLTNKLNMNNYQVSSFILLGDGYHSVGDTVNSDFYYEKVLELIPDEEYVLNNYSYYLALRNENLDKAKEMASGLVQRFPQNASYLDTYAWVLYKLNEFEDARIILEKAVSLSKEENSVLLDHLGDVYLQLNLNSKAKKVWKKALKIEPENIQIAEKIKKI